jgi:hypothetical protein
MDVKAAVATRAAPVEFRVEKPVSFRAGSKASLVKPKLERNIKGFR